MRIPTHGITASRRIGTGGAFAWPRLRRLIAAGLFAGLSVAATSLATMPLIPAAQAQTAASAKPFQRDDLTSTVIRLEERLRKQAQAQPPRPLADLKRQANAALSADDARRALAAAEQAVGLEPRDAEGWRLLARAANALEPRDWRERIALDEKATAGAYAAYQRAVNRTDEAAALSLLGQAWQKREIWRPALDAYRASLAAQDVPSVRATYESLREEHGFRILDYRVDSDAASPRVCFSFSEPLARGRTDFAPFVAVTGSSQTAIAAQDRELCVDGLAHGQRYAVVLRAGLPSSVGENLLKAADYEIYVRDRSPQVRFTGRNYVLPRTGQDGIPVVSVNTNEVAVEILRISERSLLPTVRSENFLSQLGGFDASTLRNETARKVWAGTLAVTSELNRDVTTTFPIHEAVGRMEPGIYVMVARPPGKSDEEDWSLRATQWFVVSDIGLTSFTSQDGLHVLARSLGDARPMAGVELTLVSRANEVLGTLTTDATGHARFDRGLARGTGGAAPGLVMASRDKADHGFLDLRQNAFDLTDRGVKGRLAPGPLDAFVFAERGVYRSGETVHLTTQLRDNTGKAVSGLPLTLIVRRPDGVEFRRAVVADQGLGGRAFSLSLLSGAPSGTWRVAVHADPRAEAIGETSFLVEDYLPERIELNLTARDALLSPGAVARIDLDARFLYGAPGAGLGVSGEVVLEVAERNGVPGLADYRFGLEDEPFEAVTTEIPDIGQTDAQGRASLSLPVPAGATNRPLQARIALTVNESGGRGVTRSLTLPVAPSAPVIGVKPLFAPGSLAEGAQASFDVVLAAPDGRRMDRDGLTWVLYRIERNGVWFNEGGRWTYESSRSTRRVAEGTLAVSAAQAARIAAPVQWGSYRLELRAPGLPQSQTSVEFAVGWDGERGSDTPDMLDMVLDKPAYRAGETMTVRLSPRFDGEVTLAVMGESVHAIETHRLSAAGTTVTLTARPEWGTSAYLVALAHRPLDVARKRMPGRAIGVAAFSVDRAARSLDVAIGGPQVMRPRGLLDLPVTVAGLTPGEEAYVTVAAVDVGILNLTRHASPDPSGHFFGQRQLGTELRDLYGFLIDGMQGTRGQIRSGGDSMAPALEGATPVVEPLARYSGVVKVGTDGVARISFDIPAFDGSVRVMATAWSATRTGQASRDVIIRDAVVMTGTLPRFLAAGDRSRFHLDIANVEAPAGDYDLDIDLSGPVIVPADALSRRVRLPAQGRVAVTLPIAAAGTGTATLDLRLRGAGVEVTRRFAVRVQPATSAFVRRTVRPLDPGARLTINSDLVADILPGTGTVSVSVSPAAALDVPGLLQTLDRYPYGCTEQVVSRALPLLYVNRLAENRHLGLDAQADERVRAAIERVLSRQDGSGAFGLWSVGGDDLWLDAYVGDFLTRARERGFAVPAQAMSLTLDRLRNALANSGPVEGSQASGIAYAAYVLARNGRPVMGDLRYLADTRLAAFSSPLARGQIGAALALLGDRTRARSAFGSALDALAAAPPDTVSRPDYGSRLRDGAGLMTLIAETNAGETGRAASVVEAARSGVRFTSTQESAWMILAAQAVQREADSLSLGFAGQPHRGALYRTLPADGLTGAAVALVNEGATQVRAVISVAGHPITPEPAADRGFIVERKLYRLDGKAVGPEGLRQNDRVVVVLNVTEKAAQFGRILLVDPLPAGLEIDNPRLVDATGVADLPWLERKVEPSATEFRDDRFVAAFDRDAQQPAQFSVAYLVRAVSPGTYVHAGPFIEDMYRPDRYGRGAFGSLEIGDAR